jgi:hypothetical protein
MKKNNFQSVRKRLHSRTISVSLAVIALFFFSKGAISQTDKKSSEKLPATMNVSYKTSDGNKSVKVQVSHKVDKKILPVENLGVPVSIYFKKVKEQNPTNGTGLIGKLMLNREGEGSFKVPENINKLISGLHEYTFIAKFDGDPLYEDTEEEITVADSKIIITYSGEDSIKSAKAVLMGWKDSAYVPVPEADLKLGIKRTFCLFYFGEEGAVTDSSGKISGNLPLDMPGSFDSTITIVAQLNENESFGTVEFSKKVPWLVVPERLPEMGRALWATADNAPLVLVFSSLTIITIIWGTIFYMVYLLIKVRKLGGNKSA